MDGTMPGGRWHGPLILEPGTTWGPTRRGWTDVYVVEGDLDDTEGRLPSGTFLTRGLGRYLHAGPRGAVLLVYESNVDVAPDAVRLPEAMLWEQGSTRGLQVVRLLQRPHLLMLVAWAPGTRLDFHLHPKGEELFMLRGELRHGAAYHRAGTWWRMPPGEGHAPFAPVEALALLRNGHLGA